VKPSGPIDPKMVAPATIGRPSGGNRKVAPASQDRRTLACGPALPQGRT